MPCEYASLKLRLADLSHNHWRRAPISGDLGCQLQTQAQSELLQQGQVPHGQNTAFVSTGADSRLFGGNGRGSSAIDVAAAVLLPRSWRRTAQHSSDADSDQRSMDSIALGSVASAAALRAPSCWLRRYCYDEGAFICLQRPAKQPAGGCTSYVYGASDLHIDPHNQCDHGGSHLAAVVGMFGCFFVVLLLMWLHHCR